ncbi:MAG TPA: histidinol-phosphatase [Actinocrinis sp.]
MTGYDDDLRLAHVLADQADSVTMQRFKALDLKVETKPDLTPVSDADKATEELLRTTLSRSRPRDAVIGEEFGDTPGNAGASGRRRWVLDPIDGTKNYVRGVPVWATLIALMEGPEPVVGVVSAPALARRWWASRGGGAFTGRSLSSATRLSVSNVGRLEDASFAYSSVISWEEDGKLDGFLSLSRSCWRTRAYGDFWSHMLVAEGAVDMAAEPEVLLWDMAAVAVIVAEAGGRFSATDGDPSPAAGSACTSNGLLHRALLSHLGD